jgi:ABC-type multidrug transport system fused ATPase/permease subunit
MKIKEGRIRAIIKLSWQAFGGYKLQIATLTVLGFLSGLLEGVGVNALIPLFSFFVNDAKQGTDIISRLLQQGFAYLDIDFSLKQILIFICLLFIFKALAILLFNYISIKIEASYEERTRNNLLKKTLGASWPYLLNQKLGHLENTLKVDVDRSSTLLSQIGNLIMILTGLLVYIFIALNIAAIITLITLALGGIIFLVFKPLIYKTRKTAREVNEMNRQVAHYVNESIAGIKTIKAMSVGDKIIEAVSEFFRKFKQAKVRIFLLKTLTTTMLQPISLIFICVVFAFSYKTPNFQFSALIAVVYLIQKIFQYIQQVQTSLHAINESVPYLQSVLESERQSEASAEEDSRGKPFKFDKKLEFSGVGFSYDPKMEILADINFSIAKGETAGLIGPSGAGKTTIVDLILRLFRPTRGEIKLDGVNIFETSLKDWREHIGYVSQDMFLKNDTVANNIRFYDNSITDKTIEEAARMANIYDFIQTCPDKFETRIGERGIILSAGQRQRVVIARILARKPQLLILDEATSALDNESEMQIQKVVENLKNKTTVLLIAHRLSTVMNCDKLLVLQNGQIIEQGPPSELLADESSYFFKMNNIIKS